jgi:hypothetical protein
MSQELVKHQPGTPAGPLALALTPQELNEFQEAWDVNIGSGNVSVADLSRIKVMSGAPLWLIPGLEGEQTAPKIEGVVVLARDTRAYWKSKEAGNSPPDCSSKDAITGVAKPGVNLGGECAKCPMAQFGSDGEGQACKQIKQLFMLRGESMLPELVSLPPTSVQPANRFFVKLQASRIPHYAALISIELEKAQNAQGKPYGKAKFTHIRTLTPDEKERALQFRKMCKEIADRVIENATAADAASDAPNHTEPATQEAK